MADLTPKQALFVKEYLVDLNATAAYRRAGYTAKGNAAEVNASRLLGNAKVAAAVAAEQAARAVRVEITADMVLKRWWEIATADPNDLIQFRRYGCRYCHGIDHKFQWVDEREYEDALQRAMDKELPLPSNDGGYGYDATAQPVDGCTSCRGLGVGFVHAHDTRHLKGAARLLYAGAKETKDGFEIKMQDQGKALENVARHLGMFKDRVEVEVTNLADLIARRRQKAANREA